MATARVNFTKSALEAIPPPSEKGSRLTFRDTKVAGLELRVTSSGVKSFSLVRWVPALSKAERIQIGPFPDLSVEQARKIAAEHIAAIAAGRNPAEVRRAAKAEMTFGEFFDIYIERHSKVRNRRWEEDREKFRRHIASGAHGVQLARMKLSAITRSDIATLHSKLGAEHPVTANHVLALVSSMFNRAIEWDIYEKLNPAKGVKKFKVKSRGRFLLPNELPRFFAALDKELNDTLRDFFLICLLTGARRGNVQSMRWDALDLENRRWTIPGEVSKNGEEMTVVLTDEAVGILNARKEEQGRDPAFVFPGRGENGYLAEPRKAWERLLDEDEYEQLAVRLRQAGHPSDMLLSCPLPQRIREVRARAASLGLDTNGTRMKDLRIHDLRRTLASWQAKTGASLPIIGKSLGHKSVLTTQIYARLDHEPVRTSVELATSAMLTAAGKKSQRSESHDPSDSAHRD